MFIIKNVQEAITLSLPALDNVVSGKCYGVRVRKLEFESSLIYMKVDTQNDKRLHYPKYAT